MTPQLAAGDAVIVVDVQNDFCPGGPLAVGHGDQVVPVLNSWLSAATRTGALVVASRDWHPANHQSFAEQGGQWPRHCVQDTPGAAFHRDLKLPANTIVCSKATGPDSEAYSAFDGTNLKTLLETAGVNRVFVGGLSLDYCVHDTALDALRAGFEVHLIRSATRPVERNDGDGARAVIDLQRAGAIVEDE